MDVRLGSCVPLGIALVLALTCASGCAIKHKMTYDMHDVPMLAGGPFGTSVLQVEMFTDARDEEVRERRGSFNQPAVVMREGDDWYCTADEHWSTTIDHGVAEQVAAHLRTAKLFGAVFTSAVGAAPQYVLRGNVTALESCRQRELISEAFVSQMGLIGLLIQAMKEVDYDAVVRLGDVQLIDAVTQTAVWQGDVEGAVQGKEPIDAIGLSVYSHVNTALKLAIEDLVAQFAALPAATPPDLPAAP